MAPRLFANGNLSDWVIVTALTGHSDPLFGAEPEHEYESLFRQIVNLAPPSLGVGPAQS